MLGVQCLRVDRLVGTGRGLDDLGDLRGAGRSEAVDDVGGLADLEGSLRMRPTSPVAGTLAPREDVRAAPGECMERLAPEAGSFERDPESGVEQVVLAGQHLARRKLETAVFAPHDGAAAVREERHEGEPRHLGRRGLFCDELEVHD